MSRIDWSTNIQNSNEICERKRISNYLININFRNDTHDEQWIARTGCDSSIRREYKKLFFDIKMGQMCDSH